MPHLYFVLAFFPLISYDSLMIPKIIHYCWFGGKPLPESAKKCIASWKKFCPDYEIKEWNESNYDVHKIPYVSQAYTTKKYAFVSDYARFDIIYRFGGFYFDVDVELLKPLPQLDGYQGFFAMQEAGTVASGLGIASEKGTALYNEILQDYNRSEFLRANQKQDLTTVVTRVSDILKRHGLKKTDILQTAAGYLIYPSEYFNPKNMKTQKTTITPNTVAIHHFDASWVIPSRKKYLNLYARLTKKLGHTTAGILLFPWRVFCVIQEVGISGLKKSILTKMQRHNR